MKIKYIYNKLIYSILFSVAISCSDSEFESDQIIFFSQSSKTIGLKFPV